MDLRTKTPGLQSGLYDSKEELHVFSVYMSPKLSSNTCDVYIVFSS